MMTQTHAATDARRICYALTRAGEDWLQSLVQAPGVTAETVNLSQSTVMSQNIFSLIAQGRALVEQLGNAVAAGVDTPAFRADIAEELREMGRQIEELLATTTPPAVEDEFEPAAVNFELPVLQRVRLAMALPTTLYAEQRDEPFTLALRGLTWLPLAPWLVKLSNRFAALEPKEDILLQTAEALALEQAMHVSALAAVHGIYEMLGWDTTGEPLVGTNGRLRHELIFELATSTSEGLTIYMGADHPARQQATREITAFAARIAELC